MSKMRDPIAVKIAAKLKKHRACVQAAVEQRRSYVAARYAEAAARGPIPRGWQQRLAEEMKTSKASVSRWLSTAKAEGRQLIRQDAHAHDLPA